MMSSRSMSPRPASDETLQNRLNPLAPEFSPKSPRSTSPRSAPAVALSPKRPKKPMRDASFKIDMDVENAEPPAAAPPAEDSKPIVLPASAEAPPPAPNAEVVPQAEASKDVPGSSMEHAASPSPAAPQSPPPQVSIVPPTQDVDGPKAVAPISAARSSPVEQVVQRDPSPEPPPKDPNAWQTASRRGSRGQSEPSSMEPSSIESEGTGKKKKKKGKKGSAEVAPQKPVVLSQSPPPVAKPKAKSMGPGMFGALQQDASPEGSDDGEPIPPAAAPEAAPAPQEPIPPAAAPEAAPPAPATPAAAPEAIPPASAPETGPAPAPQEPIPPA